MEKLTFKFSNDKVFKYSDNYYHLSDKNASNITEARINEWIKECVQDIINGEKYSYVMSGNTLVFCYLQENQSGDFSEIGIVITRDYYNADFSTKEIKQMFQKDQYTEQAKEEIIIL